MPRPTPTQAPNFTSTSLQRPLVDLELEVITPMFGGVQPGVTDEDYLIRGPSIRGQLRFWWRACNAHKFGSVGDLFRAESAIWGMPHREGDKKAGIHAPSSVNVAVQVLTHGSKAHSNSTAYPQYALFPFRAQTETKRRDGWIGTTFRLTLTRTPTSPWSDTELLAEIESTVWAWVTFGGIGARTRRGCGALRVQSEDSRFRPPDTDVLNWLTKRGNSYLTDPIVPNRLALPLLKGTRVAMLNGQKNAVTAWKRAIELMFEFRQGGTIGRNAARGTSRWPEANSIRKLTQKYRAGSPPPYPIVDFFPRAELGLPIIFHFKDHDDPPDRTLQTEVSQRLASPIILKPLATANGALPLVVMLNTPLLSQMSVAVQLAPKGGAGNSVAFHDPAKASSVGPLHDFNCDDARSAFFAYVTRQKGVDTGVLG